MAAMCFEAAGKHDIILFSRWTLSHDLVGDTCTGDKSFAAYIKSYQVIAKQIYNLGFKQKRKVVDKVSKKNRLCGNFRRTLISLILYEDDISYAKIANKRLTVSDF